MCTALYPILPCLGIRGPLLQVSETTSCWEAVIGDGSMAQYSTPLCTVECRRFFVLCVCPRLCYTPELVHLEVSAVNVVLHPAWGANHNMHPSPQGRLLRAESCAPIDTYTSNVASGPNIFELSRHLQQFPRCQPCVKTILQEFYQP